MEKMSAQGINGTRYEGLPMALAYGAAVGRSPQCLVASSGKQGTTLPDLQLVCCTASQQLVNWGATGGAAGQ